MKKFFSAFFIIFLSGSFVFAFTDSKEEERFLKNYKSRDWVQYKKLLYIDNKFAFFVRESGFTKAVIRTKIINDGFYDKNIQYAESLYLLDCANDFILASTEKYYDKFNKVIKEEKIDTKRMPQNIYEEDTLYYMCKIKKHKMQEWKREIDEYESQYGKIYYGEDE